MEKIDHNMDKLKKITTLLTVIIILTSGTIAAARGSNNGLIDHSKDPEEKTKKTSEVEKCSPDLEGLTLETIDEKGDVGKHTSMEIYQGNIYVSYYSKENENLRLAVKELYSSNWNTRKIDREGSVGKFSSLDVSDEGKVHIAYYDENKNNLNHVVLSDDFKSDIDPETVDSEGDVGKYASLDLDEEGTPHISYYAASEGNLKYAVKEGGSWNTNTAISQDDVGLYTSLKTHGSEPHISFYNWKTRDLMYAKKEEGAWTSETIEEAGKLSGKYTSLEIDDEGYGHIACYEWTNNDHSLKYVTNSNGGTWESEEVDENTDHIGTYTSLELVEGEPAITYHEWDEKNLKLASKGKDGGLKTMIIDGQYRVGAHCSIEVINGAEAHISYYDQTHGDLEHARYFIDNTTPLPPENFKTRSKHGKIMLEWGSPQFDGIKNDKNDIEGYNLYRSDGDGFELLKKNLTGLSYTDDIPTKKEPDTYRYRVAAVNRLGVGENTSTIKTKARYFSYKKEGPKTNRYEIREQLRISGNDDPDSYTIKWDFDYEKDKTPEWDEVSHSKEVTHHYEEVGLKNVLLEIENGNGETRRYLQSAWIIGEIELTSTYEIDGSNEVFFSIGEIDLGGLDFSWNETSLNNTYVMKGPQGLPYQHINFHFLEEEYRKGNDEKGDILEPESIDKNGKALWNQTLPVSDAEGDTEVTVDVYLYNEYRDTIEQPFVRSESEKPNPRKKVEMIDTPTWFYPVLDIVPDGNLTIKNQGVDGFYHGWNVSMDIPSLGDIESADISSISDTGLNKMDKFFGGEYGFTLNLLPDGNIEFSNDPESLDIETTLFKFETGIDDVKNKSGNLDNDFGKTIDYAAEVKKEVTVGVAVNLKIDREGIEVKGALELGLKAEINIDIPLYSIGIADVGLVAEVGGDIGVTFDVGGLSYDENAGLTPSPPAGQIPVELGVGFGGGPYGEVGEGLARVEGKFLMDLGVGVEVPSMSKEFNLGGRFEVVAEALYGLWEKSWSWELISESSYALMNDMRQEDPNMDETFNLDRLSTRDYTAENKDIGFRSSEHRTVLEDNVGPQSSPQTAFVNNSSGIAVWSSLSTNPDGNVQSDLYMSRYNGGGWTDKEKINETKSRMEYDPKLVTYEQDGDKKIALIFSEMQNNISGSVDIQNFYENNSIRCLVWSQEKGSWESAGLNHSVEGKSITSFDVASNDTGGLYTVYRTGNFSLDIVNQSLKEEGTIGVLEGDPSNNSWKKELEIKKNNLSSGSSPSIRSAEGKGSVIYSTTEKTDDQKYPYHNRTVLVEVNSGEKHEIRKTANSTTYTSLSKANDDLIASWVENRTTIKRKEIDVNDSWSISDLEKVYDGRTVSNLNHKVNKTSEFYTFQSEKNAVPKIIQSKGDGWGYLRSASSDKKYGEVDYDFGINSPKMIYTNKENVIRSWHSAHYSFDGMNDSMAKDISEEGNDGKLSENCSKKISDLRAYGRYLELDGENEKMKVNHSESLDLTETNENFTITSLINLEKESEGYLMEKNGSWAIKNDEGLVIELWNGSGKQMKKVDDLDFPTDEWVFMAVRYQYSDSSSYLNVTLRGRDRKSGDLLTDQTVRYELEETDSINDSERDLIIGSYPGKLKIDDVRLVRRYLPDASIQKINNSAYPNFDPEYTISTQDVPPYVNFTYSGNKVVGEPVNFKGESLSSNLNWTWDFENGDERYGQNISHIFNETGYHTVKLEVENNRTGAKASCSRTYHVVDNDPPEFEGEIEVDKRADRSVELNWTGAEGESEPFEYRIHHVKGEADFNTRYWKESTRNTSIVLKDLEPKVKHHVKVTVSNDVGLTNTTTDHVTFELEDTTPPDFTGLDSAYTIDHESKIVRLRWDEASDHSEYVKYKIYHSQERKNLDFNNLYRKVENQTSIDLNVQEIGDHHFAVRAEDLEGNIDQNQVIKRANVKDTSDPYLEITNSPSKETMKSKFSVEWNAIDNESGVSRYWVKTDYKGWSKVEKNRNSYTFVNLPDGERRFTVKAVDGENNTAEDSIEVTVSSNQAPGFEILSPQNGADDLSTEVTLRARVKDPDNQTMDVRFVDEGGKTIGEKENVSSESIVSEEWKGIENGETYGWKVIIDDGYSTTSSDLLEFTTRDDGESENYPPEKPEIIRPEDEKEGLGTNVTLSTRVHDEDGDKMEVSFYDGDSNELIDSVTDVGSGEKAYVYWTGLERNSTYSWYVTADDGENETKSDSWEFSTLATGRDAPPKQPVNPLPQDGSEDLSTDVNLSVEVFDPDDEVLDVTFYDHRENQSIGSVERVKSGNTAQIHWKNLERNRTYRWYAVAEDGENETRSETWKFSTVGENQNAPPKRPFDPLPEDGRDDLGTNVTLSVEIFDPDNEILEVTFYNHRENQSIGSVESVKSGNTARTDWKNLERNKTYRWYAVARDGENETRSETWSFTTAGKGQNSRPKLPYKPSPKDGANEIETNVTLSVEVSDSDGDLLTVSFYRSATDELIGDEENIESGNTASMDWEDLEENLTYSWYVVISDGNKTVQSDDWSFTTVEEDQSEDTDENDENTDDESNADEAEDNETDPNTDKPKNNEKLISPIQIILVIVMIALIATVSIMYYRSDRDLLE